MNEIWYKRLRAYRHNSHLGTITRAIRSIEVNTLASDTITEDARRSLADGLFYLREAEKEIRKYRIEKDGSSSVIKHYPKRRR